MDLSVFLWGMFFGVFIYTLIMGLLLYAGTVLHNNNPEQFKEIKVVNYTHHKLKLFLDTSVPGAFVISVRERFNKAENFVDFSIPGLGDDVKLSCYELENDLDSYDQQTRIT